MIQIFVFMILVSLLSAEQKYPADTLLHSEKVPVLHKVGIVPISLWQRVSYNSNLFNCQFYPSCSNYGAIAINQEGIIKGSIMASERITRCNPFANGYHVNSKSPFLSDDGRLIDPINLKALHNDHQSPLIAGILSAFIPGIGRAYAGRTMDGILGFWTFCLLGTSANQTLKDNRTIAGPLFLTLTAVAYFGEIYGSWRAAKYYQKVKTAKAH